MRFKDKVVLVTGGGSGIGQATSMAFAREGARVSVVDWNAQSLSITVTALDQIGCQSMHFVADVSKADDTKNVVSMTLQKLGRIDILVCNAGIIVPGTVVDLTEQDMDRMLAVNFKGVFLYCKEVIPHMIKQGGGRIVNVSSIGAHRGGRDRAGYCPTKAAISLLTRCMALDHAKDSILVNAVCPGSVDTGLTRMTFADPLLRAEKTRIIPTGRFAQPNEIARVILFLASEDAGYMTGAEVVVDAGLTA